VSYNKQLYSKVVENRFRYLHKILTMTGTEQVHRVSPHVSSKVDFQTVTVTRVNSKEYCVRQGTFSCPCASRKNIRRSETMASVFLNPRIRWGEMSA
jgi:predicted nucleic acid-binding Zn ribbon protein